LDGEHLLKIVGLIVYILVAILLVVSILLQSARVPGFTGSFGSSSDTFFGRRRGLDESLARATAILAFVFFALSLLLARVGF
jgi:preprotein translocase subunit SecG